MSRNGSHLQGLVTRGSIGAYKYLCGFSSTLTKTSSPQSLGAPSSNRKELVSSKGQAESSNFSTIVYHKAADRSMLPG